MTCPKEELFGEINKNLEIPLALFGCKWYNLIRAFCQGTFSVSIYAQKQGGYQIGAPCGYFGCPKSMDMILERRIYHEG